VHGLDRTGRRGGDVVFHFHCFELEHYLPGSNSVAGFHQPLYQNTTFN